MIEDKFLKGFIAGLMGDLFKAVLDQICYYWLHTVHIRYLDFSAFLIYGHTSEGWADALVAQVVQLLFSGVLGAIFIYLLDLIGARLLYFKSVIFSSAVWFSTYSVTKLFDIDPLVLTHFRGALSHLVTSVIEGLVVAFMLVQLGLRKGTMEGAGRRPSP